MVDEDGMRLLGDRKVGEKPDQSLRVSVTTAGEHCPWYRGIQCVWK